MGKPRALGHDRNRTCDTKFAVATSYKITVLAFKADGRSAPERSSLVVAISQKSCLGVGGDMQPTARRPSWIIAFPRGARPRVYNSFSYTGQTYC